MARPCKSVNTLSKHLTKEEKLIRSATENMVQGCNGKISSPKYLTPSQKKIFRNIVKELQTAQILGSLDVYILAQAAISIDRLQSIEASINEDSEKMYDRDILAAKDRYTKDFFRCCNELSLSPQSRAKLGNITLQVKQQQEDPLLKVLGGGKSAN